MLSTSDKLKLSKAAREGGVDRFTIFASDGKLVNNFQTMYDLHTCIESISKTLTHFDMQDVFQIIPAQTVQTLSDRIDMLFECQTDEEQAADTLHINPTDAAIILQFSPDQQETIKATTSLESINIANINIIKPFQDLNGTAIQILDQYYAMYRSDATAENLAWRVDHFGDMQRRVVR